ncbi:MBL fold metallo-hydrolase [Actinophytocola oryzae]|uniref:Metallo-beta-lactamase superfamily protein n=1 Tax=Actinophytocola oryzae TaxID=502181 RepID=A0A4R7W0E6_9PSEU|nr:MBL fold metallo-hydrolase [Actinophytocola oryzae]TDV55428.1 metallo-beta-lactamase superfamily protein [Actinophytocola oryzae]
MRVHHLNCGTMRPLGGGLIDGGPGLLRRSTMVCHCLLVEADDGLVLVDSGLGVDDVTNPKGSLAGWFRQVARPVLDVGETAVRQVVGLGFRPEDVRHVVLTHLDLDHAGGLRDFPNAKVHVYAAERGNAFAQANTRDRHRFRPAQWSHDPDWQTYETGGEPWFGFEAVHELNGLPADEFLIVPLGGHTLGHAGVAVRTGDRWLLHCGDAYFFHGETGSADACPRGLRVFQRLVETDRTTRLSNQDRLRTLVADHGTEIETISAHDPVELHRYAAHQLH